MADELDATQLEQIAQRVAEILKANSQGVGDLPVVSSLAGINSLPALKNGDEVVEAPLSLLSKVAEDAAQEVHDAIANADEATAKAVEATTAANTATTEAIEATTAANEATGKALGSASTADASAQRANESSTKADTATENANTATANANKATEDSTAATNAARVATTEANSARDAANEATEAANTATTNANTAADEARHLPKIQDGTWWVYDIALGKYVDTDSPATSQSPKIIDGIWWTWDDSIGDYVSTGWAVNSDFELTKEKIEGVFTGNIKTHTHEFLRYSAHVYEETPDFANLSTWTDEQGEHPYLIGNGIYVRNETEPTGYAFYMLSLSLEGSTWVRIPQIPAGYKMVLVKEA